MQIRRPQSRYKNFLKIMMAVSFFIPIAAMFLPYDALFITWFGISFFAGMVQGMSQNLRQAFNVGLMTLAASVIGVAVGTAALFGGLVLGLAAISAVIVTAPTIVLPILIGVAAIGVAALSLIGLYKGLNWISKSLSNWLEYDPVNNASAAGFDDPGHDHGAAAALLSAPPHSSSSYSSMLSSFPHPAVSSSALSAPNPDGSYERVYPSAQPVSHTTHPFLANNSEPRQTLGSDDQTSPPPRYR